MWSGGSAVICELAECAVRFSCGLFLSAID
jgi:hypothetical protein